METLIIYGSAYGNTEKIAKVLAEAIGKPGSVILKQPGNVSQADLDKSDLVIVGSPTQGGRPIKTVQNYLDNLSGNALRGKKVVAFDTRFAMNEHGLGLKLLMKSIGFAAPRIGAELNAKGGEPVAEPKGFIVEGKEGPLKNGEIERAYNWMKQILSETDNF